MTPEEVYLGLTILVAFVGTAIIWNDLCTSSNTYQYVSDNESEQEEEETSTEKEDASFKED